MAKKPMKIEVKKGALHSELGIKQGKKIPLSVLEMKKAMAKRTGNTTLEKRTTFAINARKWKH
jgi:hypothetical protein